MPEIAMRCHDLAKTNLLTTFTSQTAARHAEIRLFADAASDPSFTACSSIIHHLQLYCTRFAGE